MFGLQNEINVGLKTMEMLMVPPLTLHPLGTYPWELDLVEHLGRFLSTARSNSLVWQFLVECRHWSSTSKLEKVRYKSLLWFTWGRRELMNRSGARLINLLPPSNCQNTENLILIRGWAAFSPLAGAKRLMSPAPGHIEQARQPKRCARRRPYWLSRPRVPR